MLAEQIPVALTEMQIDALTELVNLGVGNAAGRLREMVREEVLLSIPSVCLLTRSAAAANLGQREGRRLVAVHQDFDGEVSGRAMLIFPGDKSMELVRAVVGGDLSSEEIMEMEPEALAEIGNILLNGCLGTIANSLQQSLRISLPEVVHGDGNDLFDSVPESSGDSVLFVAIEFTVRRRAISGHIAMLLDLPSLIGLRNLLNGFITEATGITLHPAVE